MQLGREEVPRSRGLRNSLNKVQSITTLIAWRKEGWRKVAANIPSSEVWNELCSTKRWQRFEGNLSETAEKGRSAYWPFRTLRYHLGQKLKLKLRTLISNRWRFRGNCLGRGGWRGGGGGVDVEHNITHDGLHFGEIVYKGVWATPRLNSTDVLFSLRSCRINALLPANWTQGNPPGLYVTFTSQTFPPQASLLYNLQLNHNIFVSTSIRHDVIESLQTVSPYTKNYTTDQGRDSWRTFISVKGTISTYSPLTSGRSDSWRDF